MYSYTASLFALLVAQVLHHVAASPEAIVTPAPIPTTPENLRYIAGREYKQALEKRASSSASWNSDGMDYCFGSPSICSEANNLFDQCNQYEADADNTEFFTCQCTNGYVAADIA
jgi:hypothetical protein